jgi:hypothetical protein
MQKRPLALVCALLFALAPAACKDNVQHEMLDATQAQEEALEERLKGDSADAARAQTEATREAENAVEKVTGRESELVPITPADTTP